MTHVKDRMSDEPATCRMEDSLNRAAQLMWEHDCGCIPVVDDADHVVGMITDRDVCMGAYTQGRSLATISVASVCTKHVFTCLPDDPLDKAEALLSKHGIRRLPVVEQGGRLVGVLSFGDLANATRARDVKSDGPRKRALSSVMQAVSRLRTATQTKLKREHAIEGSRKPAS